MSIKHILRVFHLRLEPKEKLVMLSLAAHANDDDSCWPGIERIGFQTGYSTKSVLRAIKILTKLGLITKTKSQRHNYYTLHITGDIETLNEFILSKIMSIQSVKKDNLSSKNPSKSIEVNNNKKSVEESEKKKEEKGASANSLLNLPKTAGEIKSPYEELWEITVRNTYKGWKKELSPKDKWTLCLLKEQEKLFPIELVISTCIRHWSAFVSRTIVKSKEDKPITPEVAFIYRHLEEAAEYAMQLAGVEE